MSLRSLCSCYMDFFQKQNNKASLYRLRGISMKINVASYTNKGGYEINEDSFLCGNGIYAVADGLGGHANGEVASAATVEYLKSYFSGNISDDTLLAMLEGANNAVCSLSNGSCSTVAAVVCSDEQLRLVNVGDSRAYYFRDGKLFAMTKDHSVCQLAVEPGDMTFDEIRHSADRSKLLKVLGSEQSLNIKKLYEPIIPQDGDAFLICSDGFWEYVYENEMEEDLLRSPDPEKWLNYMLERQLVRAKNEGDNYTAVCGYIHTSDESADQYVEQTKSSFPKRYIRLAVLVMIFAVVVTFALLFAGHASDDNEIHSVAEEINENDDALSVG